MNRSIDLYNSSIHIKETTSCYVSPYSMFYLQHFPLIIQKNTTICDYGAGTGVLGIAATHYSPRKIVFLEKTASFRDVLQDNVYTNMDNKKCDYSIVYNHADINESFDTILCNPASLPDICNPDEFCKGGEMGLDMIFEVISFSKEHLKPDGTLYLIVTSILPHSIIQSNLDSLDFKVETIAKEKIPFRSHYTGIKEWVDANSKAYPEMSYYEHNGFIYEELNLWKIQREKT